MRTLLISLALISSRAAVDQSRLSEPCRALYNACLNACPQGNGRTRGTGTLSGPTGDAINTQYGTPRGNNTNLQIDVAQCTNRCNEEVKDCR